MVKHKCTRTCTGTQLHVHVRVHIHVHGHVSVDGTCITYDVNECDAKRHPRRKIFIHVAMKGLFSYAQLEIYYIKYIKGPQLNIYTGVDIKPEAEHPIIH